MATRKTTSRKTGSRTGGRRAANEEEDIPRGRASERTNRRANDETRAPRQARGASDGHGRARSEDGPRAVERARRAIADLGRGGVRAGDSGRRAVEREMEETFGFVPEFYRAVPECIVPHAWGAQRDLELADTALDMKTKELIGLAVAAHMKCRYCVYFHSEAAKAHGASDEELREAATMGGLTALFSDAITGARVDFERFQREVDRAIEHMVEGARSARGVEDEAQI